MRVAGRVAHIRAKEHVHHPSFPPRHWLEQGRHVHAAAAAVWDCQWLIYMFTRHTHACPKTHANTCRPIPTHRFCVGIGVASTAHSASNQGLSTVTTADHWARSGWLPDTSQLINAQGLGLSIMCLHVHIACMQL